MISHETASECQRQRSQSMLTLVSIRMIQMLRVAARRRDNTISNMVRDTKIAVKTLAASPMVSVVAKPRIGPVPNWNRNAAAMSDATCVSTMVHHTRSKPAVIAALTRLGRRPALP